jgi:hypothetical protein
VRKGLASAVVVAAIACGGDSPTEPSPSLTGWWTGTESGNAVCVRLLESGTSITGDGAKFGVNSMGGGEPYARITVTGTIARRDSISLVFVGYRATGSVVWTGRQEGIGSLVGALSIRTPNETRDTGILFSRPFATDVCAAERSRLGP